VRVPSFERITSLLFLTSQPYFSWPGLYRASGFLQQSKTGCPAYCRAWQWMGLL